MCSTGVPAEGPHAAAQAQGIGHVPTAALLLRHAGAYTQHMSQGPDNVCADLEHFVKHGVHFCAAQQLS